MKHRPTPLSTYDESLEGVQRTVLLETPETRIVLYKLRPGHEVLMHAHPEAELGVMISGTATHTMILTTERGGRRRMMMEEVHLRRGDTIAAPSGVPHAYVSGPGQPSVVLGVVMAGEGATLRRGSRRKVVGVPARAKLRRTSRKAART